MTKHQILNKLHEYAEAVKLWQCEIDEIHTLELALSQALAKGSYDIKDFAPALAAIHEKEYQLTEKIRNLTEENICLLENELRKEN